MGARSERARVAILVGLGTIAFIGLVLFARRPAFLERQREYRTSFRSVAGLNVGDEVRYGGVRVGSISALTMTIVAAGWIAPKTSPWTAMTSGQREMSVTNMRVRTTSSSVKPASPSAVAMMASVALAWAAMSPGCADRPSGPASVVPATQQPSPTTTARL